MRLQSQHYPIDILICILLTTLIIPIILLDIQETIRILLGLPFLLFIPGYVLVFVLFPQKKTDRGIDIIERIALSFGLSIAIVPLIGLGLNYTPWGIRLIPILASIAGFNLVMSVIAWYRWWKTSPEERFIVDFTLEFPKHESKMDKILSIILIISILLSIAALIYVIATPKTGEQFTEFYLLGAEGTASNYPQEITQSENNTITVGIVNHEYKTMNYTLEIWLINQSIAYNTSTQVNETIYHEFWHIDSQSLPLEHTPVTIDDPWQPQWEQNISFSIDKQGTFKLAFLLYTSPTESYDPTTNYVSLAEEKISSAYRSLHLWITVNE